MRSICALLHPYSIFNFNFHPQPFSKRSAFACSAPQISGIALHATTSPYFPSLHMHSGSRRPKRARPARVQAVFERKRSVSPLLCLGADHGLLCVSHPGSKGFPRSHLSTVTEACSTFSTDAGGQGLQRRTLSNEAKSLEGKRMETSIRVPATNSCSSCTNPLCLIPWWFMILPTNLLFPSS